MDAKTCRPNKHQTFLCTRFNLAAELVSRGYSAEKITNPFRPEFSAWLFQLSPDLAEIVKTYYLNIGKPIPKAIDSYLMIDQENEQTQSAPDTELL